MLATRCSRYRRAGSGENSLFGLFLPTGCELFGCYATTATKARSWERVSGRCRAGAVVWDDPVMGGEAGELGG